MNQMTRILIKIKIRDKKKFTKQFPGGQYAGGKFSGGIFPRTKESTMFNRKFYLFKRKYYH